MQLIATKQEFGDCLKTLSNENVSFIAVDTEFVRQKTFYPELCLIQIAFQDHCFVVDTLSIETNAQSLTSNLYDAKIPLVLHACKQDLEIFFHLQKSLPDKIFDTQVAATFLGLGESISYDNLVKHYLGIELNKALQDTDWSRRPLSQAMITYAASDVIYLRDLYPLILEDLEKKNRLRWAMDEMKLFSNTGQFSEITDSRLKRLDISKNKYPLARAIFAFREEHAAQLNLNRGSIFPDKVVPALFKIKDLNRIREYLEKHTKFLRDHALISPLLDIIEHAQNNDEDTLPSNHTMNKQEEQMFFKLRAFRDEKAIQLNLPPSFLANNEDIKRFLMFSEGKIRETWRWEVFESA